MPESPIPLDEYRNGVGREAGVSRWIALEQSRIDAFATCTDDLQFIHVDPERASETPFGGTIAHGFLTLSLLSTMAYEAIPAIRGQILVVNYGLNSLRFLAPVRSARRVRGRFTLNDVSERGPGQWLSNFGVIVEIEAETRPALVAEWLSLSYF